MLAWLSVWSEVQTCISNNRSLKRVCVCKLVKLFWLHYFYISNYFVCHYVHPICHVRWLIKLSCSRLTTFENVPHQLLNNSSLGIFQQNKDWHRQCHERYDQGIIDRTCSDVVWWQKALQCIKGWFILVGVNTVMVSLATHTHNHLMALFPGLPGWAGTTKVKPIWILLKQETVSGSGISWAICKSAPRSWHNHASTPPLSFLQAGCPSCRPTNSVKALKASGKLGQLNKNQV